MGNLLFKTCLFLDPVCKSVLDPEEAKRIKRYIVYLGERKNFIHNDNQNEEFDHSNLNSECDYLEDAIFESHIASFTPTDKLAEVINVKALRDSLALYDTVSRPKNFTGRLLFWKLKQETWPDLSDIALSILATSFSHVSVERSFSSLRFILNDLRTSIGDDILESILVINRDVKWARFLAYYLARKSVPDDTKIKFEHAYSNFEK